MISNRFPTLLHALEQAGASTAEQPQKSRLMDEAAFQRSYQQTAPKLRSYIRLICGDTALADDLLQESYYRFLLSGLSDRNDFQIKAYLYKTARSLVSDHWRRMKREQRWREQSIAVNQKMPNLDLTEDMTRLFRTLKPRQQELLWLAYVEGFDHREIAALMSMKEKSIRVVLARARDNLDTILQKAGFGPRTS